MRGTGAEWRKSKTYCTVLYRLDEIYLRRPRPDVVEPLARFLMTSTYQSTYKCAQWTSPQSCTPQPTSGSIYIQATSTLYARVSNVCSTTVSLSPYIAQIARSTLSSSCVNIRMMIGDVRIGVSERRVDVHYRPSRSMQPKANRELTRGRTSALCAHHHWRRIFSAFCVTRR